MSGEDDTYAVEQAIKSATLGYFSGLRAVLLALFSDIRKLKRRIKALEEAARKEAE